MDGWTGVACCMQVEKLEGQVKALEERRAKLQATAPITHPLRKQVKTGREAGCLWGGRRVRELMDGRMGGWGGGVGVVLMLLQEELVPLWRRQAQLQHEKAAIKGGWARRSARQAAGLTD